MSSTVNGYMQALLALTGNSDLEQARNMLLRSMSDQDLVKLVIQVVSQNFPRDGLEEIALRITDIIKRGGTILDQHAGNADPVNEIERQTNHTDTVNNEGELDNP